MSVALAIFVKTPGSSPIKTRLGAAIGTAQAEGVYRRSLACVLDVVRDAQAQDARLLPHFAVAEAEQLDAPAWRMLPRLAQGDGGLGERMSLVHAELVARHGASLLVGADAPQITSPLLLEAVHWLSHPEARVVLGPAHDGGFWLVGANRVLPPSRWNSVRYSAADTAREFRDGMRDCGEWLELQTLADIDVFADLARVQQELDALAAPLAAQRAMRAWLPSVHVTEGGA